MNIEAQTFHNPVFDRIPVNKKETLLGIAVDEFAEKGFAGSNINTIADKAGISIGSLYKYFPTKEKLYLSVVNHCYLQLSNELTPVLENPVCLKDKLKMIIDLLFDSAKKYRTLNRLYNRFTTEGNSALAQTIAEQVEKLTAQAYQDLLKQAKQEGLIDEGIDERVFAFLIDNIFITLQFSLSTQYYENRMTLFLGDKIAKDADYLKEQTFLFICHALGLQ